MDLSLALLVLVGGCGESAVAARATHSAGCLVERRCIGDDLLDGDTHVATVTALPAVALIFADTAVNADARVLAALARPLAVASLLALPAALAARLGRQVFLIRRERRHRERRTRRLARCWGKRSRRDGGLCDRRRLHLALEAMGTRLDCLGGQLGHQGSRALLHRLRPAHAVVVGDNVVAVASERVPVVVLVTLVRTVVTVQSMVVRVDRRTKRFRVSRELVDIASVVTAFVRRSKLSFAAQRIVNGRGGVATVGREVRGVAKTHELKSDVLIRDNTSADRRVGSGKNTTVGVSRDALTGATCTRSVSVRLATGGSVWSSHWEPLHV